MLVQQFFQFHGVRLEVRSSSGPLTAAVEEAFAAFVSPSAPADLIWTLEMGAEQPCPAPNDRPLFRADRVRGYQLGDTLAMWDGHSTLRLPNQGNSASGIIHPKTLTRPRFFSQVFLPLATQELLRRCERYYLHAAAVGRDGAWMLCPAESGRGKSTITLALLQAGWQYLTDDAVLLRDSPEGPEAAPFSCHFHATADAVRRFPILREVPHLADWAGKFAYDALPLFGPPAGDLCRPRLLAFPEIGAGPSRLEELDQAEALARLLRLSVLLFLDADLAPPHLETLRHLVQTAPAWRWVLGEDARDDPRPLVRLAEELWSRAAAANDWIE